MKRKTQKVLKIFILSIITIFITLLLHTKTKANSTLTSSFYKIDNEKNVISRIGNGESYASAEEKEEFLDNLQIYKEKECENEVTEGFVGTGMFLKYEEELYEISVVGDFNGDGKATQVELTNTIR